MVDRSGVTYSEQQHTECQLGSPGGPPDPSSYTARGYRPGLCQSSLSHCAHKIPWKNVPSLSVPIAVAGCNVSEGEYHDRLETFTVEDMLA